MICKKCGAEIPDGSKKCPNCGASAGKSAGTFRFDAQLTADTGDIIIRIVAVILGAWVIRRTFSALTYSLQSFFSYLLNLNFSFGYVFGFFSVILALVNAVLYVALGVFYCFTAVRWDRKKMDLFFTVNLFLTAMILLITFVYVGVFLIQYGFAMLRFFGTNLKGSILSPIAFLIFYLVVGWICPRLPLAEVTVFDDLLKLAEDAQELIPDSLKKAFEEKAQRKEMQPQKYPNDPMQVPVSAAQAAPQVNANEPVVMLKTNRGVIKTILLSFITCDIYYFYQIHKIGKEMNTCCKGDGRKTPGLLMFILLCIITCGFYVFFYLYRLENRIQDNSRKYGLFVSETGMTILLWEILGSIFCLLGYFVALHLVLENMNRLFAAYNNAQLNAASDNSQQGGN